MMVRREPLNIVVVEDDIRIADWLAQGLRLFEELEVRTITSHFEGLIGNGQWDLVHAVLCDWSIPYFDTAKFLEYLAEEKPHVRRVLFTAYPLDSVRTDLADVILQKPAGLEEICRALTSGAATRGEDLEF